MQTVIGNDLTKEDAGTIACSGYVSKVLIILIVRSNSIPAYILQKFLGETFKSFVYFVKP